MTPVRGLAAALAMLPLVAFAQEGQGFAELRVSLFAGVDGRPLQVLERVRPSLETELSERVKLVATLEAGLAQGRWVDDELERAFRQQGLGALVDEGLCCTPAYQNLGLHIDGGDDYLDVDRLYLDIYAGSVDLRLGRQALNWGSAQFFNPTDPFPEVLLAEPWRPRRGVNAVRAIVPFGARNDFSAVVALSDSLDELRAAARLRLNHAGTDFALVGTWRGRDQGLVGIDLRGTLVVGWWLEAAYLPGRADRAELAVGVDYSLPFLERATVYAQYYRNSAGSPDPSGPGASALGEFGLPGSGAGRDAFAPFTRGRDYALLGASLEVLPELGVTVFSLQNLNDGSGLAVPTVRYTVLDWLEASVSAQLPYALWGRGGELRPRPEDLRFERDYGAPHGTVRLDLSGLVPAATFTFWTRASF